MRGRPRGGSEAAEPLAGEPGELDPIKGMMQGKLRVHGDLPTIVRYVQAANELVRLTGRIDTQFPDEA